MSGANDDALFQAAEAIVRRGGTAALTGAGISVASGIPDFRSPGGVWTKYEPRDYATLDAFQRNPERVWVFLREVGDLLARARPNAGHRALADLERSSLLAGVATQNIDALHQAAGSRRVIELHGSSARLRCIACGQEIARDAVLHGLVPRCPYCGGLVKPDVVLFGELLPAGALEAAERLVREAGVLLVIGTSGEVHPVAGLPQMARAAGALLVELNLGETAITDECDLTIRGPVEETLPRLVERVKALR